MQRLKLNSSSSSKTLKNSINESKMNLNDSAILGYGSRFVTNSFLIHSERDVSSLNLALNLNKSLNVSQIQSRPSSAPETTRNSFKNSLSPTEANKKLNQ